MHELSFSDYFENALTNLEKAKRSLNRQSRISTLDIENLNAILLEIKQTKADMIAVMSMQTTAVKVAEQFTVSPARIYQIRTEYLRKKDEYDQFKAKTLV